MNNNIINHDPEAERWYYKMMASADEWERFRFKDPIRNYHMVIAECQKLYDDNTPATTTENFLIRATCLATIKRAQRDLENTLAEYDDFLRYQERTAISK